MNRPLFVCFSSFFSFFCERAVTCLLWVFRGRGGGGLGWSNALTSGCASWRGAGTHGSGRRASASRGRRRAASSDAVGAEPEHHPLLHFSSVSVGGASGDLSPGKGRGTTKITAGGQKDGHVADKPRVRRLKKKNPPEGSHGCSPPLPPGPPHSPKLHPSASQHLPPPRATESCLIQSDGQV